MIFLAGKFHRDIILHPPSPVIPVTCQKGWVINGAAAASFIDAQCGNDRTPGDWLRWRPEFVNTFPGSCYQVD